MSWTSRRWCDQCTTGALARRTPLVPTTRLTTIISELAGTCRPVNHQCVTPAVWRLPEGHNILEKRTLQLLHDAFWQAACCFLSICLIRRANCVLQPTFCFYRCKTSFPCSLGTFADPMMQVGGDAGGHASGSAGDHAGPAAGGRPPDRAAHPGHRHHHQVQ